MRNMRSRLVGHLHAQRMPAGACTAALGITARIKAERVFRAYAGGDLAKRVRHGLGLAQKMELSTRPANQLGKI